MAYPKMDMAYPKVDMAYPNQLKKILEYFILGAYANQSRYVVLSSNTPLKMDNPNITMEEYIRLQEEKALSRGETFNWQTATYALLCGPTVSPLNDNEIDFRISFDESDDEDYMLSAWHIQQQALADVSKPDELCSSNKRYDLMSANKKLTGSMWQCPSESKNNLSSSTANDNCMLRCATKPSFSMYGSILQTSVDRLQWNSKKTVSIFKELVFYSLGSLCKIFSKFLTTRVTGWDQPPLQIMKMKKQNKVGMRIPAWMITDEMKLTEHYKMYAYVFGLDVPLTQSQPTESTQGTHRTPSAPRVT
ncbi:hypothetical protein Tco_0468908 [Tanacetum coccineum]